jgi:hypothetical protein
MSLSLSIAMHGSRGNSKATKRAADKLLNETLARELAEIRARYPLVVDRRAELLARAKQTRSYIDMAPTNQAKKLLAQAEALEREAAEIAQ